MDLKEISDTLTAAHEYTRHLKNLNKQLENAEHQVESTAGEALQKIEVTFANLLNSITQVLTDRKSQLIQQTKKVISLCVIIFKILQFFRLKRKV